jgi:hypothetical protein
VSNHNSGYDLEKSLVYTFKNMMEGCSCEVDLQAAEPKLRVVIYGWPEDEIRHLIYAVERPDRIRDDYV